MSKTNIVEILTKFFISLVILKAQYKDRPHFENASTVISGSFQAPGRLLTSFLCNTIPDYERETKTVRQINDPVVW